MFGRIGSGGNKGNDKNSKGGNNSSNRDFKLADGKSLSYVGKDGVNNVYSDIGKSFGSNSYTSGGSSRGGEESKGGQSGQSYLNSSSSGGGNSTSSFNTTNSDKVFSCVQTSNGWAVKTITELAIAKNGSGKGINALANLDVINLSNNKMNDNDALNLSSGLLGYALNVKTFYLNNNSISDTGLDYLIKGSGGIQYLQMGGTEKPYIMQGLFTHYNVNITKLDLSNNNLTDVGADILSHALVTGSLPSLKVTHLEGNKITKTGEGFLVKALKQISQDIMVTLEKYSANLGQKVIKPILKDFVKYAEKNGVDTTHIATNKNVFEYMKDISIMKDNFFIGLFKCKTRLDYLESGITEKDVAVEVMVKMIGKKFTPLDTLVCIYESSNETFVTPEGVDLAIKFIDLIGDSE